MDVALPANGRCVAEDFGDRANRVFDVGFGLLLCFGRASGVECNGCEHCSSPSAKILRRKILASDLAQIFVHILGSDIAHVPVIIDVLKQILTGQILQPGYDRCDAAISHVDFMLAPAFAPKTKTSMK